MSVPRILLLGAGAHARVILDALHAGGLKAGGCLSPVAPERGWPQDVGWLGEDDQLAELSPDDWHLMNGVGSIGDTGTRMRVFLRASQYGFFFMTLRHPSAVVARDVAIGEGSQVMAGAIVQTGARLGRNVVINTGAIVDHDAEIADHVHIAPGVTLSGGVTIGEAAHIGTGAVVRQGVVIGAGAVIGVGSVVIKNVPAGMCHVGNPARPLARRGQRTR